MAQVLKLRQAGWLHQVWDAFNKHRNHITFLKKWQRKRFLWKVYLYPNSNLYLFPIYVYWTTALAKVSYEYGCICQSVLSFAVQDLRVDSSVFLIICMKIDSPQVRKVARPEFWKKSPDRLEGWRKKSK